MELTLPIPQRGPDSVVTESNDIRAVPAVYVHQESRVLFHPPSPGLIGVAKIRQNRLLREQIERAVLCRRTHRDPYPIVVETHNVYVAEPVQVRHESRVLFHSPPRAAPVV